MYPYDSYYNMYTGGMFNGAGGGSQLVKVTGMMGAQAYQMRPNSTAALFDSDRDVFYVKSTDGAGYPTIRAFAFTPLENDTPDYVTRKEFNELKGLILNGKQLVPESNAAGGQSDTAAQD